MNEVSVSAGDDDMDVDEELEEKTNKALNN